MSCRIYINSQLSVGATVDLPDDQAHYLRSVMRLSSGDSIILFNGRGGEYRGRIEQLGRQQPSCMIESFVDISREMPCRVHIVQAACRSEKIETVLQKATELGAASFQVVRSERSSLKLDGAKRIKRIQRWQKIIIEAAEQSGRTAAPSIEWRNGLSDIAQQGACFILHPDATHNWPQQRDAITKAPSITLAIGPEGGWSIRDTEQLSHAGFQPLRFGPRIMRTETAAPALLAAIQSVMEA